MAGGKRAEPLGKWEMSGDETEGRTLGDHLTAP